MRWMLYQNDPTGADVAFNEALRLAASASETAIYARAVRARSLLQAGNDEAARALAGRAREATLLYYAPSSKDKEVAEADTLLRNSLIRVSIR